MWALAQVLPDIVIAFCLSLIAAKTARQKLLLTKKAWRCLGNQGSSARNKCKINKQKLNEST